MDDELGRLVPKFYDYFWLSKVISCRLGIVFSVEFETAAGRNFKLTSSHFGMHLILVIVLDLQA